MLYLKVIPLAALFASGVWAQSDMAQCGPGFNWNKNSLGQDPCTVGSMMDSSCRGIVLGMYTYPPLDSSEYYVPPQKDDSDDMTCDCNTVMYNLYMACASCQGAQIYSWQKWIPQCNAVYVTQYPADIAQGTAVPRWAYINITSLPSTIYNDTIAMSIGRDPEVFPKQISTTFTISSSTFTGSAGPSVSAKALKGGINVGAIAGGVAGSVVLVSIIAVAAFFCVRHRRQQHAQQLGTQQVHGQRGPIVPARARSATSVSPIQYNPSDPSTFPQGLPDPLSTTSFKSSTLGTYSGAAEI